MPDSTSHSNDASRLRGTFTLIRGCMFSGKTTELLRRLAGLDAGEYTLFKHVIDDRYASDAVVSHMGQVLPARKITAAREIHDCLEWTRPPSEPRAIRATEEEARMTGQIRPQPDPQANRAAEEGAGMTGPTLQVGMAPHRDGHPQLPHQSPFTVAIDEGHFFDEDLVFVVRNLIDQGISCVVTALDRDSWANPFPLIEQLGDLADEDVRLYTICARCGDQADRTQRLTPVIDDNMVGGPESYEPRCAECWTLPVVLAAR